MTTPAKKTTPVKATAKPAAAKAAPKPAPAPAPTKVEPVEAAVKASQETVETVVKTSTAVAKKGVEKAVAISQDQVAAAVKAGNDAYKGYEDMIAFSQSNIDAMVKSNEVFAAGLKELNATFFKLAQDSMEESVAVTQELMNCKTLAEVVELQAELAKKQYEKTIAESRKLSSLSSKVVEDASKPLASQFESAVSVLSKPIAA